MIRKEGNQYCVVSKDGSKKLGCFPTRQQAVKRLQQIEYFKHAKSEKEVSMNKVTDPVKDANVDGKVPGATIPNLDNTGKKKAAVAAIAAMTTVERKTYASRLIEQLEGQQKRVKEALKLADKLMSDGISEEEFGALAEYTQSDILFQLLEKSKANANRTQVMAIVAKKARKAG